MSNLRELYDEDIKRVAPAAFSKTASPDRSKDYQLVHTMDLVAQLRSHNYEVTQAFQDQPRRRDPKYVRHMLRMTPTALLKSPERGAVFPQVLLWNSHNGRTMARLCAGFFRMICSNGMIVGESTATYAVRHYGKTVAQQVEDALKAIIEKQKEQEKRIEEWKKITLSDHRMTRYAEQAAEIRFGTSAGNYTSTAILAPRRPEDMGDDLWRVFNRVQENLTHGKLEGLSANQRRVQSRPLTGIGATLDVNRRLWQLTEATAQAA